MNAPIIWIFFPIVESLLLIMLRKKKRAVIIIAASSSFLLCLLALLLPIGTQKGEGLFPLFINPELEILGRRFFIQQEDNLLLALIYGVGTVWFAGSLIIDTSVFFPALGMAFLALIIAASTVEPFLYAALLIEGAALICLPFLVRYRDKSRRGIFRFIIFQTLGMPFILLAGWFLVGGEVVPVSEVQLIQATALLIFGFAFWLGIFPLHTWIPMLAEDSSPLTVGFVLSVLSFNGIFMLLEFFNRFAWLREFSAIYPTLRYLGALMIIFAGIWSLFQQSLERYFAYALIFSSGSALISLGLIPNDGIYFYAAGILPKFVGILLMSWSMQLLLARNKSLQLSAVTGRAGNFPFSIAAFLVGFFAVVGLPLSPGFLTNALMLETLSNYSVGLASIVLIGAFFLALAGFRLILRFLSRSQIATEEKESLSEKILLICFICLVVLFGLFPSMFLFRAHNLFKGLEFLL